jgi:prevent-host-death family protein
MKTVGIKELKARLSSYINEVRSGAKILVTDHADEVALIAPLSDEYRLVQSLQKSGKMQWSRRKPRGLEKRIVVAGKPISATILEERE